METRMEIEGRRRHRYGVRDEVEHASATTDAEAREIAHRLIAEGFTVWIFQAEPGPGISPRYQRIATLGPDRAPRQGRPGTSTARCAS